MRIVKRYKIEAAYDAILGNKSFVDKIPASKKKTAFLNGMQEHLYNPTQDSYTKAINSLAYALGYYIIED